jgi:NhaA family Na+:H+ antiporter
MGRRMNLFREFFHSEKSGGFVLIGCTIISLTIANTGWGEDYHHLLASHLDLSFGPVELDYSVEHWINDGLMAIFFLLVGLEIERELYIGELSSFRNAILPVMAAIGGMAIPAIIHFSLNAGTETVSGFGIPMATDIAFALGILSLAGSRVPVSLKIFLTALAIIDDLGAIAVIALFYTSAFQVWFFLGALAIFLLLYFLGKKGVHNLLLYLVGGVVMWYCMLQSGVHASIAGVLLAFAIPFHKDDSRNISFRLQRALHFPVAFVILPLFALANTAIMIPSDFTSGLLTRNSIGIMAGLIIGKFIGIFLFSFVAVKTGLARLSSGISWSGLAGVALLGGIGFTMSIFITNLAFTSQEIVVDSKLSILVASLVAAVGGLLVLMRVFRRKVDKLIG